MDHRIRTGAIGMGAALALAVVAVGSGFAPAGAAVPDSSIPVDSSVPPDPSLPPDPATTPPPVAPVVTTTSLPLFGAPLTIELTSGPGGTIANVAVNPADGLTAVELKPNRVVFVNEAGTTQVVVQTNHGNGTQRIEARGATLADLVGGGGPAGWSGDVFGTGTITTVGFNVSAGADGSPQITDVTVSDPSATIGEPDIESHDGEQEVKVSITFVDGTRTRTLGITVEVDTDDDSPEAKVRVSLSPVRGRELPADQVAGPQSWTGSLCDGTPARVDFVVGTDGSVSDVVAEPSADVRTKRGRIEVRFSDDERVRLSVRSEDGNLRVSADPKFRCDVPPPSVNTPVSTTVPEGDDDGEDEDHGRGDDHRKDDGNGDGDHDGGDHDGGSDHGGSGRGSGDRNGGGRGGDGGGEDGDGGGRGGDDD